jgi:hypothetical protein
MQKNNRNKVKDKGFLEIKQLVAGINELANNAVPLYSVQVDHIINSGCLEKNTIEHLLDRMLDFCFNADMLKQYKKLCRYYYYIDPIATTEYVYAYREMWDDAYDQKNSRKRGVKKGK